MKVEESVAGILDMTIRDTTFTDNVADTEVRHCFSDVSRISFSHHVMLFIRRATISTRTMQNVLLSIVVVKVVVTSSVMRRHRVQWFRQTGPLAFALEQARKNVPLWSTIGTSLSYPSYTEYGRVLFVCQCLYGEQYVYNS